jgi:hypothetical protein
MGMSLALDAEVCGSGTTGLRTVVSAVTLHGPSCCRATGLCCARSAPKVRRTFRINGPGLAGCESEAACLECGGTVRRGGRRTRAGRFATWPHLGRNLDTGRGPAKPNIGTARACGPCGTIVLCGDSAFGTKKSISACVAEGADSSYLVATLAGVTAVESASGGWWSFWSRPRP